MTLAAPALDAPALDAPAPDEVVGPSPSSGPVRLPVTQAPSDSTAASPRARRASLRRENDRRITPQRQQSRSPRNRRIRSKVVSKIEHCQGLRNSTPAIEPRGCIEAKPCNSPASSTGPAVRSTPRADAARKQLSPSAANPGARSWLRRCRRSSTLPARTLRFRNQRWAERVGLGNERAGMDRALRALRAAAREPADAARAAVTTAISSTRITPSSGRSRLLVRTARGRHATFAGLGHEGQRPHSVLTRRRWTPHAQRWRA